MKRTLDACGWEAEIVAAGDGPDLYDPEVQLQVLSISFESDVIEGLQNIGPDGELGRLPYPPIQGIVYAPLGLFQPSVAQMIMVYLSVLAAVATGYVVCRTTQAKISWSVATLAIVIQPAFFSTVANGQNAAITMLCIAMGWMLWKEDRLARAGVVWGLLAYKPTWGIAVGWIPIVLWSPRALATMILTVGGLILLTIPVLSFDSWLTWFEIAEQFEKIDHAKWDWIRRDIRALFNFVLPSPADGVKNALLGVIFLISSAMIRFAEKRESRPWQEVLVLTTIILVCPRFMFYDLIVSTPAWLVAFSTWRHQRRLSRLTLASLGVMYLAAGIVGYRSWPEFWPLETASLFGLWVWSLVHSVASIRQFSKSKNGQ